MNLFPKQTTKVAKTRKLGRIEDFIQIVKLKRKCTHTDRTKLISVVIMEEMKSKIVFLLKIVERSEKQSTKILGRSKEG